MIINFGSGTIVHGGDAIIGGSKYGDYNIVIDKCNKAINEDTFVPDMLQYGTIVDEASCIISLLT